MEEDDEQQSRICLKEHTGTYMHAVMATLGQASSVFGDHR